MNAMKSSNNRIRTPAKVIPKTPLRLPRQISNASSKDSVQVFCRIRPVNTENEESCVKVISPTTVVLTPPEIAVNYKSACLRETHYIFKNVFDPQSRQREVYNVVAQPLVEGLIRGRNGLLFTYGVTGSGKTFTMTGNSNDQGIMPRCLDVLFKTINDYQTKKFVFKPDRMNGFEILSEADAMLERQAEMNTRFGKFRGRVDSDPEIASRASKDPSALDGINEDNMYAVFITYIEVYNNSVYDLLEDTPVQRTLQSKIIREDSSHNMYVHLATEVEVKSLPEAIEAFQKGQKRKRMGHTILNAESSRSHSVFTIRLVQAPTDSQGETVLQDRRTVTVSQLSLVDLAGSERTSRTNNTGQRLREAGNINNSLMTLRTCLEILRENQLNGSNKKVPYRDSKVSHLFKNYFEGEGSVKMIVCINPRNEDYDESVQVIKFAEMTQEVQVQRATPIRLDVGLTPGRRKANQLFKMAVNNLDAMGRPEAKKLDVDVGLVYSLGPKFPEYRINSPEAEHTIAHLMKHLEQRIQKRQILLNDYTAKGDAFRAALVQMERDSYNLKSENASLTAMLQNERQKVIAYEEKLAQYEDTVSDLSRQVKDRESMIREMKGQLNQKQQVICQKELEKEKQKRKYDNRLASETGKLTKEMEQKYQEQQLKMKEELRDKENRLKLAHDVLSSDYLPDRYVSSKSTRPATSNIEEASVTSDYHSATFMRSQTPRAPRGIAASNIRHRRSRSTGERWLEHRAANPVPLDTILQPFYKNRKSITKLTDIKDVTNPKTSKYCLVSQSADTDGEVETRLYKGNVIPTCGGGAQVVFDDVECLKQRSPEAPIRKRSSRGECFSPVKETPSNYSVGMGSHSTKKSKR
ncbi:kinesin-like protein KIF23 [Bradysia coprophila]|uniref:kinesin-like protein KIF23 n=1 Tax=Bradysia coprophila TaxID=38358 RepID=UPI00187D93BD|nr:kinesin-like protein KIF23 [Bradysia coprophila]